MREGIVREDICSGVREGIVGGGRERVWRTIHLFYERTRSVGVGKLVTVNQENMVQGAKVCMLSMEGTSCISKSPPPQTKKLECKKHTIGDIYVPRLCDLACELFYVAYYNYVCCYFESELGFLVPPCPLFISFQFSFSPESILVGAEAYSSLVSAVAAIRRHPSILFSPSLCTEKTHASMVDHNTITHLLLIKGPCSCSTQTL